MRKKYLLNFEIHTYKKAKLVSDFVNFSVTMLNLKCFKYLCTRLLESMITHDILPLSVSRLQRFILLISF